MSQQQSRQPRFRSSKRLDNGDYLQLAVWPGKSNPEDEVITVQIRRMQGDWKTVARIAAYRTKEGVYSELPESKQPSSAPVSGSSSSRATGPDSNSPGASRSFDKSRLGLG